VADLEGFDVVRRGATSWDLPSATGSQAGDAEAIRRAEIPAEFYRYREPNRWRAEAPSPAPAPRLPTWMDPKDLEPWNTLELQKRLEEQFRLWEEFKKMNGGRSR
jgi:hypothetical protein